MVKPRPLDELRQPKRKPWHQRESDERHDATTKEP